MPPSPGAQLRGLLSLLDMAKRVGSQHALVYMEPRWSATHWDLGGRSSERAAARCSIPSTPGVALHFLLLPNWPRVSQLIGATRLPGP